MRPFTRSKKALKDGGDKISDDEKKAASEAVAAVKTAMSGDDREDIERKTQALEAGIDGAAAENVRAVGRRAPVAGATLAVRAVTRKKPKDDVAGCRVRRGQGKRP